MLARQARLLGLWRAHLAACQGGPAAGGLLVSQPSTYQGHAAPQQQRGLAAPAYAQEEAQTRPPQSPTAEGGSPSQPRRAARPLPTPEEVRQQLKQGLQGGCSSHSGRPPGPSGAAAGEPPLASAPPALHWRELLGRLSEEELAAKGAPSDMLTDTFRRRHTYLRISLTERCNLRCLYCMPAEGVDLSPRGDLLTTPEILRLARLFAEAGVTKIRLTGGEPTLRPDLAPLIGQLRALPGVQALGLTSNGLTLARQLPDLQAAGLTLLNISLDTLQPERFERMTRRRGHSRVLAAIHEAARLGFDPIKVNVVVMRGVNEDEVGAFVGLTRALPVNVRFIEYMPFDGNVWSGAKLVPYRELRAAAAAACPQGLEPLQDPRGEVAKNFRARGHRGAVSFVTSMTQAFCGDCNRLRLLADGSLKVCLFGSNEVSLRDALREGASDAQLRGVISAAVDRKRAAHAGMAALAGTQNRAMIKIGG